MADTRWDLFAMSGLAGLGGVLEAKSSAAATGAVQRAGMVSSIEMGRQAARVEKLIPAIRLQTLQQHNSIISDFKEWAAVADANISYMGRDDRSVQAIKQRVEQETAKNLSRVRTQGALEEAQTARDAASLTSNAINERLAADAEAKIMRSQGRANIASTAMSLFGSML